MISLSKHEGVWDRLYVRDLEAAALLSDELAGKVERLTALLIEKDEEIKKLQQENDDLRDALFDARYPGR